MSKKKKNVRPHHKNATDKKKSSDERTVEIIALITALVTLMSKLIDLLATLLKLDD